MKRFFPTEGLHDLIFEDTGINLPMGIGSGLSITDPINMLAHENYVNSECEIFWFYLRDYSTVVWDVVNQESLTVGARQIDYFELSVSGHKEARLEVGTLELYFDITECLKMIKN